MSALPSKLQSGFTAGELVDALEERYELEYRQNGLSYAENVTFAPQGGFQGRGGLMDIGAVAVDATRLFPFKSSAGVSYDVVFSPGAGAAWGETAELDTFVVSDLTADMLPELTFAQQKDTMLLFHQDLKSPRIKHFAADDWEVDDLPYENLPSYDYGGEYTNGVAAVWQLEFGGLTSGTTGFSLTVNGSNTLSITYNSSMASLASTVQAALLDLPTVNAGLTVAAGSGSRLVVTFAGSENIALGDGWAISGEVLNAADAYILSSKTTSGVAPGEDVISTEQGWPSCGAFINERLFVGGFKHLPGTYMFSVQADYFNFDMRFTDAGGPRLVPMDIESGEKITSIINDRNPVILTEQGEYWLAERKVSATEAPNHVHAGENGSRLGVPVTRNEGALLYTDGGVVRELRYTDVNGNYLSEDISLLAPHLVNNVVDKALQKARNSTTGNRQALVQADGSARLATILRAQKVLAFARLSSDDAVFKAVSVNGRNEMSFIVQRPGGRRLERLNDDILLDEAQMFVNDPASTTIAGLARFNGRVVWCVADNDVFGPFTVADGQITLPVAASSGYVGTWSPPKVTTLSIARLVGASTVIESNKRIHSVHLKLKDTTSIAIATNNGVLKNINLQRFGMPANQAELDAGFTGKVSIRGLTGYSLDPTITLSQVRPGRINVLSIKMEASF